MLPTSINILSNSEALSNDAVIFESKTELDIFPPKWKTEKKKSWFSDNDI